MTVIPIKKLSQVATVTSGIGFPIKYQGNKSGQFPFYKVGDISKTVQLGKTHLDVADHYIGLNELNILKGKVLEKNSIVFAKIGEAIKLDRRAIITIPSLVDNNVMALKANDNIILDKYLYYFFLTIKLGDLSRATTVPSIRKSDVEEITVPCPTIVQQDEIVKKIEGLFSELDEGVKNLRLIEKKLEIYRETVLEKSFTQNGKNTLTLNEVTYINPKLPKPVNNSDVVSFLPMKNVEEISGKFSLNETRKVSQVKKGYTPFADGDIIMAKITPCFENGKIALLENLKDGVGFGSTEFFVFRCKGNLNSEYLFYFLNREWFRRTAKRHMSGAVGQQRVTRTYLENVKIYCPSIAEQKTIVRYIKKELSLINSLKQVIQEEIKNTEILKQSILKNAFEGKLK